MNGRTLVNFSGYALCGLLAAAPYAQGQVRSGGEEGTIHVPAFDLPISPLLSPEAQAILQHPKEKDSAPCPSLHDPTGITVEAAKALRACVAEKEKPRIERMKEQFAVTIAPGHIGGVPVEIFIPQKGISSLNKRRVLINLHGGGFVIGDARNESIPIAGVGKIKVVGIDYRMGPEHQFPAASEDVAAVYKELLKAYAPAQIGIYGCSAGGKLTAQSMGWFQKVGLPRPGAIGIFGTGAAGAVDGDSAYFASALHGVNLVGLIPMRQAYYGKSADLRDPLIGPLSSPGIMAKFPPTLILSATRDQGLSNAARTHAELVKLSVSAELHVWEGLGHCFHTDPRLPEAREAYDVIVRFFESRLGQSRSASRR